MVVKPEEVTKRISILSASIMMIIGLIGIFGRVTGFYDSIATYGLSRISVIVSLAFIFLAVAVFIFSLQIKNQHVQRTGKIICILIMIMTLAICIGQLVNSDFDLQRILLGSIMSESDLEESIISPLSSLAIFIGTIGLIMLFLPIRQNRFPISLIGFIALIVFSIGSFSLLGYAYGTPQLYGGSDRPVSIATSVGLLFLAIGILALQGPNEWPTKILFVQESRYMLLRFLIPLIASIILISGWITAVLIPMNQDPLLLTALFDIFAVLFTIVLVRQVMVVIDTRLKRSESERNDALEALNLANEKLNILDSLTRHDILNQVSVSMSEAELAKRYENNPKAIEGIDNIMKINKTIVTLLKFQKDYKNIGAEKPKWLKLEEVISQVLVQLDLGKIKFKSNCQNFIILADPMIEKAFFNIIENSIRHGGVATSIKIECKNPVSVDPLVISIEDNGIGISNSDKENIFSRNVGKGSGLGLFLTRQILTISGMTIKETGSFGKGARFEITVPKDKFKTIFDG